MPPGSAISNTSSFGPKPFATGNIRRAGSLKAIVTTRRPCGSCLPVRRKNGTPAHRQFSISTSSATNVSVSESGATPSSDEIALVLAAHDTRRIERLHRLEDLQSSPWRAPSRRATSAAPSRRSRVPGRDASRPCRGTRRCPRRTPRDFRSRASRGRRSGRGRCGRGSRPARTGRSRSGARGCSAPTPCRGSGRCGRRSTRRRRP